MNETVEGELVDERGAAVTLPGDPGARSPVTGKQVARDVAARAARRGDDVGPSVIDMALLPAYVDDVDPDDVVPFEVDQELLDAIPETTRATYEYQWARFVRWCGRHEREHLPATIATVRFYIWAHYTMVKSDGTLCGRRGRPYAPATVSTALGVVCAVHQWNGYPSPWKHPVVAKQLAAYERKWLMAGHTPDEAYALTLDDNIAMVRSRDTTTCVGLRDAAMIALQFATGCRAAELCNLNIDEISFETPTRMLVLIRWSKTKKPRTVPVESDESYAPDCDPVALVNEWLDLLRDRGYTTGPLWRNVRSGKRRLVGHSGKIMDTRVDRHAYEQAHRLAAKASGVDRDPRTGEARILVTHSERAGMITSASDAGVPIERIAPLTGHSPNSPVIFKYVRSGKRWGEHNPMTQARKVARERRDAKLNDEQ